MTVETEFLGRRVLLGESVLFVESWTTNEGTTRRVYSLRDEKNQLVLFTHESLEFLLRSKVIRVV